MARWLIELAQALVLFGGGAVAWYAWMRVGADRMLWLVLAAGATCLAVDERLDLHEAAGRWISSHGFQEPGGINHADDVVLLGIAFLGCIVALPLWPAISRQREMVTPLAVAAALFLLAVVWDATASTKGWASWWFEESVELAGGAALLVAYLRGVRALGLTGVGGSLATPASDQVPADWGRL